MGLGVVAAREFRRGDYVAVYGLGCRVLGEIENPRVAAEWRRMQASQGRYEARYTMRVAGMGWVDGRGSTCLAHMINAEITGHGEQLANAELSGNSGVLVVMGRPGAVDPFNL